MESQDAASQLAGQGQLSMLPWQTDFQQADRLEDAPSNASSCGHTVRGCPVFHSTVIQVSPAQPATYSAAYRIPDAYVGREGKRVQSLPPPRALQAARAATAELPLSGGIPLPAPCSHMAADSLQQIVDETGMQPWDYHVPEQQDMHSGAGANVPVGGGQISPAQGTPHLDLLNSIDWLTQWQQGLPGALAYSPSDSAPGAGPPGPPSMLSAAGMAPSTPQL